ncbi:hypothetical protein E2C01_079717 [Portunus trituberculatus]|uniref:Uncharacterized protein n=1 Tax=Portunus trituberculatus TaxID=210409 RepID=A0A5B7IM77_PORTR|nr:hypothetical protein [Portunus trituberculatus]
METSAPWPPIKTLPSPAPCYLASTPPPLAHRSPSLPFPNRIKATPPIPFTTTCHLLPIPP